MAWPAAGRLPRQAKETGIPLRPSLNLPAASDAVPLPDSLHGQSVSSAEPDGMQETIPFTEDAAVVLLPEAHLL